MKYVRLIAFFSLTALLFCGCAALRMHYLDENLPEALDAVTLLPIVESVTVTRLSDGASVTVEGAEIERLRMCFENIQCARTKTNDIPNTYTVAFRCVSGETVMMYIGADENDPMYARRILVGEYIYYPLDLIDIRYIVELFA